VQAINIITSSDSVLVRHIFTQLKNIKDQLVSRYEVHFWLFHYRIEKQDIAALAAYSEHLGIVFHEIFVDDYNEYEILRKGADEQFPLECYFYFLAHKYLPEDIERALYIDAGDIIFDGDISEFYFATFEGNFVIASMAFSSSKKLYNFDDLYDTNSKIAIVSEYVNAGSLMLNLKLMRIYDIRMQFYCNVIDFLISGGMTFSTAYHKSSVYYSYDQGLLAAAFVGHLKFWGYEKYGYSSIFMPYNFRAFILEKNKEHFGIPDGAEVDLGYQPRIIHLLGNKPWNTDKAVYDTLLPISRKYLDMFWEAEREAGEWLSQQAAVQTH
jgi:lipopolysaccharide biosynthesis glycosyltransferase